MAGEISQLYPDTGSADALKIQGKFVSGLAPTDGQTLLFNSGTQEYVPGSVSRASLGLATTDSPTFAGVRVGGSTFWDNRLLLDNQSIEISRSGAGANFYIGANSSIGYKAVIKVSQESGYYWGGSSFNETYLALRCDGADILAQRNGGTAAQTFRLYGTYTDAANYRRLALSSTTAGAFTLGVEGAGTGASGNTLTVAGLGPTDSPTFYGLYTSINGITMHPNSNLKTGNNSVVFSAYWGIGMQSGLPLYWSSGSVFETGDLYLHRDAAGTLAIKNGSNPQALHIYNTYTDASNYERGFLRWSSNVLEIGAEAAGTGTARNLRLYGKVGIGASPLEALHVQSTFANTLRMQSGAAQFNSIQFFDNTTAKWELGKHQTNSFYIRSVANSGNIFEALADGSVGIAALGTNKNVSLYPSGSGIVTIGGSTNYASFASNGTLSFVGTARLSAPVITPAASATPASNGDLVIEATSNTSVTIKLKGSDGVVRSVALTLS